MKSGIDILNQFEKMDSIEPSAGWNEKLLNKLNDSKRHPANRSTSKLIVLALIVLLTVNLLSIIENRSKINGQNDLNNLKSIASEFMINTNSTKF